MKKIRITIRFIYLKYIRDYVGKVKKEVNHMTKEDVDKAQQERKKKVDGIIAEIHQAMNELKCSFIL